ncbi:hypothetical protein V8B97DRAFT_1950454 [Scleroderma yunnanense]
MLNFMVTNSVVLLLSVVVCTNPEVSLILVFSVLLILVHCHQERDLLRSLSGRNGMVLDNNVQHSQLVTGDLGTRSSPS